ncbi:MAG: outer membrane protein [Gemmatimonadota bacterium]
MRARFIAACLLLPLVTSSLAHAQRRGNPDLVEVPSGGGERRGFWITGQVGAGGESNRLVAERDYSRSLYKPTLALRLGGTVNPHLRLGGELFGWFDQRGDLTESLASAMAIAQIYPLTRAGLFLKGGGGVTRAGVHDRFDVFSVSDWGFGWTAGVGYDIAVGRKLAITPVVEYMQHRFDGRDFPSYYERVLNFGLGITFQTR